jgi:hypothetical protein
MRRARAERGQILPIVALAIVVLCGAAALSIDVGYAYYAKRQLQAATDAAALAGAQDLPNRAVALQTAETYATANSPSNVAFNFSYETKCTTTALPTCVSSVNPNSLMVTGTATTDTWFAGIFGLKHFSVSAHANACSPCSAGPVDLVIAIDRTGSMCLNAFQLPDCTDMNSAKNGIRTMLGILSPPYAKVGLVSFPPVQTTSTLSTMLCAAPYNLETAGVPSFRNRGTPATFYKSYFNYTGYDAATRGWVTDALNTAYKDSAGAPVLASGLYLHTTSGAANACVQSDGLTSYSEALRQAQAELVRNGRAGVPNYIVFLTDGEANIGSVYGAGFPQGGIDDQRPCQAGINAATLIKATGTTIYSIGYSLGNNTTCKRGTYLKKAANSTWTIACTAGTSGCYHFASTDPNELAESPAMTANYAVSQIASSSATFFSPDDPSELAGVFAAIATDMGSGSSRLVDDGF